MKRYLSATTVILGIILALYVSLNQKARPNEKLEAEVVQNEILEEDDATWEFDSWKGKHQKVRGIYVTGPTAGIDKIDDIIALINSTELNAIVLDVKDDNGNVTFKLDNEDVISTEACVPYIPDINELLAKLKENDIYVIARIPCFKDPILAKARPELCLRAIDGVPVTDANGNEWVNPCREEVWDYVISIAESCCELGFDEIQLDYVRFPVGQNAEDALYGAPSDDDSRQQYISQFLSKVCEAVHKYKIPISADVFGTIIKSQEDSRHIGQDYENLARSIDVLSPMIYPSHYAAGEFGIEVPDAAPYETIYAALNGSREVLSKVPNENQAVIRPWLQAFTATWVDNYIEYNGREIRKQIQAVYDAGYDEWIFWNSKSNYTDEGFEKN